MKGCSRKLLLGAVLCIMVSLGACDRRPRETMRARQCRMEQLSMTRPDDRVEAEGGLIEMWDDQEDQFQCAGVSAMRITVRQDAVSQPNYHSAPGLVYVEQGQGVMGMSLPGCPETFQSRGMQRRGREEDEEGDETESGRQRRDMHQPTRRIRKGDIVAIPQGTVHWCFNDGNEDLVVVAVHNLNADANQLDQTFRTFYLAGGLQGGSKEGRGRHESILRAFDPELLAEALGTSEKTVRQIQEAGERGPIIMAKEMRQMIRPPRVGRQDEEQEEEDERRYDRRGSRRGGSSYEENENGFEEGFCNMRFSHNIDTRMEADIFTREAGRINVVCQNKLPVLGFLDMSAEKGHLVPNAIYGPHWSINGHSVVYVTRGEGHMQVADDSGRTVLDERMREGDMVVIPQFFVSSCRAGRDGLEYVSFKTTANPTRSPLNGHASVFNAMPVAVLSSSYQISRSDAVQLKQARGHEQALFSPFGSRS